MEKKNNIFIRTRNLLLCLITGSCEYSLKKFFAFFVLLVVFYLALFTEKSYTELLVFLGVLLGMREYSKQKYFEHNEKEI